MPPLCRRSTPTRRNRRPRRKQQRAQQRRLNNDITPSPPDIRQSQNNHRHQRHPQHFNARRRPHARQAPHARKERVKRMPERTQRLPKLTPPACANRRVTQYAIGTEKPPCLGARSLLQRSHCPPAFLCSLFADETFRNLRREAARILGLAQEPQTNPQFPLRFLKSVVS